MSRRFKLAFLAIVVAQVVVLLGLIGDREYTLQTGTEVPYCFRTRAGHRSGTDGHRPAPERRVSAAVDCSAGGGYAGIVSDDTRDIRQWRVG